MLALNVFYTCAATVLRPSSSGGVVGDPVEHLTGVLTTPPMPAETNKIAGYVETNVIQTTVDIYFAYLPGHPDVLERDTFVVDGESYLVRIAQQYTPPSILTGQPYTELIVEKASK